jgi:hypothetical protein
VAKYDVKNELRPLYAPSPEFGILDVPEQRFVAVEGEGDPNTSTAYAHTIEALYGVSYTLKFASKADGRDYVVGPLEALWRAEDPSAFVTRDKGAWQWTAMITLPDWLTDTDVEAAVAKVRTKKENPALAEVRPLTLHEGLSVQILHLGPYDTEGPSSGNR